MYFIQDSLSPKLKQYLLGGTIAAWKLPANGYFITYSQEGKKGLSQLPVCIVLKNCILLHFYKKRFHTILCQEKMEIWPLKKNKWIKNAIKENCCIAT